MLILALKIVSRVRLGLYSDTVSIETESNLTQFEGSQIRPTLQTYLQLRVSNCLY